MIFQGSNYIDQRLNEFSSKIEKNEIGLRVICGRIFKVPCILRQVIVTVTEPRKFNILEEFILRAANEMKPPPTKEELSKMFGLDKLFIDSTCKDLKSLELIKIGLSEEITISEIGYKNYQSGFVPGTKSEREVNLVFLGGSNSFIYLNSLKLPVIWVEDTLLPGLKDKPNQMNFKIKPEESDKIQNLTEPEKYKLVTNANSLLKLQTLKDILKQAGKNWERPEEGYLIDWSEKNNFKNDENSVSEGYKNIKFYPCGVVVIEDTAEIITSPMSNFSIRIYNLINNERDTALETVINEKIIKGNLTFEHFFPPKNRLEINEQIQAFQETLKSSPIKQNVISIYQKQIAQDRRLKTERSGKPLASSQVLQREGKVEYLWGEKIKPKFIQTLRDARHSIILVSPWITEEVVDQEFTSILSVLASKRVAIVIGWGISKNQATEDRVPSEKLLKSLMNIRSPEGFPMVSVWWLGNIHNKDFLVDYKINISGSFNYLSYRGDRDPRGESVHYVSFPEPVNEALNSIEPLFDRTCNTNWNKFINDIASHLNELTQCCISWVIVRKFDTAFTKSLSLLDKKNERIEITKPFNAVCATLARLPANEMVKISLLEKIQFSLTQAKNMNLEINLLKNNEYLKLLLGCYATKYKEDVSKWLLENKNLFETLGIILPNITLESSVDQFIDIANKKNIKTK